MLSKNKLQKDIYIVALFYVNTKTSPTMLGIVCDRTQHSKSCKPWVGHVTFKASGVTVVTFGGLGRLEVYLQCFFS